MAPFHVIRTVPSVRFAVLSGTVPAVPLASRKGKMAG